MTNRNSDPISVTGLIELRTSLRAVSNEAPRETQKALKAIAAVVATAAAAKVPKRSGKAAGSYKPRATQTGAGIAFGGKAAVYAPWLEFGGSVGKGHIAGKPFSGSVRRDWMGKPNGDGRYLYPTISEHREETQAAVLEAMETLSERHGLEVRHGQ